MKTESEILKMKEDIQNKIDDAHSKAVSANQFSTSDHWWDKKRQYMAQYNILLEVLK